MSSNETDRLWWLAAGAGVGIALYTYGNRSQRWRDNRSGQFVSFDRVDREMARHTDATFVALDNMTNALYAGQLSLSQWQLAVAQLLKEAHLAQAMFAAGGKANMGPREWGRVGRMLRDEYQYLAKFAIDIAAGKVSLAQALVRVRLYGRATRATYWNEWTRRREGEVWWVLGIAEHCPDCVTLAENSPYTMKSLPTVPAAGDTECKRNCKCRLEVR